MFYKEVDLFNGFVRLQDYIMPFSEADNEKTFNNDHCVF